ncbi:MAG: hypothetical protein N2038_03830 [Geminicoccaceae bacterium]|nr:hypothetical protein [Geminicoccaceae bacterium]MCX7629362.1 hypothetical protein [Geminicoccaceae bacterium]MDW8123556.1 hypothetical protein [Geminicoccaceae bacterium]MDW8339897.1 hypothetical protein [Geminicoccaceae bacterium]
MNALRHGLRARGFALLPHEDEDSFQALCAEVRRAYAPADAVEAIYVDAIAIAIWRERRADRLEAEVLADIAPAEEGRSCGSDLRTAGARASLATVVRYRTAAQMEHRRALAMLAAYRRLRAARTNEPARRNDAATAAEAAAGPESDAARPCTNEPEPPAPPPVEAPETVRVELREEDRVRLNPLDTNLARARGRDPDLVLPVPGLEPRLWPKAQDRAIEGPYPPEGPKPYRRVPGLPWHLWWDHQHLLAADRAADPDPAALARAA